ncbi:MAG: type pilus assembly protein PilA [Pseudonocardiales bacterium]|jgi:prepilin-type N-terminal cleavage/methylation domain-containing protein|nr:type pilus assembly protein PilA [Pseudonocardiales bacterium]
MSRARHLGSDDGARGGHPLKGDDTNIGVRTQRGFTIVELLIVIIVIGILAALTLNAFSGAEASARNAKRIDTAKQYEKALYSYLIANGSYPPYGGGVNYVCLGTGYLDTSSDGIPDCGWTNAARTNSDPTFDASFTKAFGNLPPGDTQVISYNGGLGWRGVEMMVNGITIDGAGQAAAIEFMLEGAVDCKLSPVLDTSWPNFRTLTNQTYSEHSPSGDTVCIVGLPQPSSL